MEAKELRCGNYLKYKDDEGLAIVELIHRNHFDCRDEFGTFTPNGVYEPIPLTEEWLLKMKDNPNKATFPSWIKYVHEAQNWYYWNNNKTELLITLKNE